MSGVCDPYQPLEARYELSRRCLEILGQQGWPVTVQTRSPLVLRDLEILKKARDFEVGLTVTTGDDDMRRLFEPNAPPIKHRLDALEGLHRAGVRTFAMVAPMLPGAEGLAGALAGRVDYVMVDRMNYNYGTWVYRKYGLDSKLTDDYFYQTGHDLANACRKLGIECRMAY
jgi:DNA repair photolyase